MGRLEKGDIIVARALLMCLLMPAHLQVYMVMLAAVWFVGRTVQIGERPTRTSVLWALLLGGGYLFYVVALPLTPPEWRREVARLCERRVAYLLLPLIFGTMARRFRATILGQLMYFVYGSIISCAMVNAAFVWHHFFAHDLPGGPAHVIYRVVVERFTGVHPTYLSMYLCFSIAIVLWYLPDGTQRQALKKFGMVAVMLGFMLAMFAKAPLIALFAFFLIYAFAERKNLYRFKWAFVALGGVVVFAYAFIPFFRQRAVEMLGLFHKSTGGQLTDNSVNVRKLLFNTDAGLLKRYWLSGMGPGRLLNALNQRYFFHSLYRGYWVGYFDPHSQYFYEWLSFGMLGIVYIVAVLCLQFARAISGKNLLYTFLLVILATTFFTESLLARQQGVLFYAIFTSLLFFTTQARHQESR